MWTRVTERIEDLALFVICALLFCLVKTLAIPGERTFRSFLLTIIVSVPCGTLAGAVALELGYGDYLSLAVTGCFTIFADRMIAWLLEPKRLIDLDNLLTNIINKYFGK